MNRLIGALLYIFFISYTAFAQSDTAKVLKLSDLFELMLKYHPLVKQANIIPEIAYQELRMSRAGFEPKFISNLDKKTFDQKNYYHLWQNQLKVPTWFGAEFKVGYDEALGTNVNPQNYLPGEGLSYIGVSVPIGQGLIIDQRRAMLRMSKIFRQMSDAEKNKILNKLFFDAAKDYWDWYYKYHRYLFSKTGYDLAMNRNKFVIQRVNLGEEPAIDSTEAVILLQNRYVNFNLAKVDANNALLQVSNYLWNDDEAPVEMDSTWKPATSVTVANEINTETLNALAEYAKVNHPEVQKLALKVKSLEVERRLAIENFRPVINLNYNLLSAGKGINENPLANQYYGNYYKAGFDIQIPIFMRKERGKYMIAKYKIEQTKFEQNFTLTYIQNQLQSFYNELKTNELLLRTQLKLIKDYTVLRNGELEKFNNGESSLFLVNTRESNLIESEIKKAEIEAKYGKAKAGMYWAAGKNGND
ncbi:MAG: TolC family protein [Cytophagales bacterium]|nr:TolC family protein [Cytophagales bacterium]